MSKLTLDAPASIAKLTNFIKESFSKTKKTQAVIAVSGGIDSALSLSLLLKTFPKENVWPVLLPYGKQDMTDAQTLLDFWKVPSENHKILNIASIVDGICKSLQIPEDDYLRKGNVMARVRMIAVFDYAKGKDALVVGTENKSEHFLGYFTRYGDEASDLEPLLTLYKTQVRELVQELNLPEVFLEKAPSAGLWDEQSDEIELGFSYELADQVLHYLVDQKLNPNEIISMFKSDQAELVKKVVDRVSQVDFKHHVPYHL